MATRSILMLVISTLILSGCSSLQQNRKACITVGAVAGALAGAASDSSDDAEDAAAGALVGGVAAWLICRTDSDGDGVLDENDSCPGTSKSASVDSRGCALDSDRDGVADHMDACPNTERGAAVDSKGCDKDSDGDGVRDDLDQCPRTPSGASVNSKGCELDDDGDGVVNSMDACPTTPSGKKVDRKGCHIVFTLSGVNFEYNSSELTGAAKSQLAQAVAMLGQESQLHVNIVGHTDDRGPEKYNMKLSAERASAVMDFLIEGGIESRRLSSEGKGESMPVASNDTEEGRAKNRRVEFTVSD